MSELGAQLVASEQGPSSQASPGGMIRESRQAAGIHIEALAVALKVPVSKLEALEADNYQVLPDAVFVRALASSVCRSLKMDPVPVLALMPQSGAPRLSANSAGINTAFKDGSEKSGGGVIRASLLHPAFLAALALLLGAAVLAFYPRLVPDVSRTQQQGIAPTPSESPKADVTPAGVAPAELAAMPVAAEASPSIPLGQQTVPDSRTSSHPPLPVGVDAIEGKVQLLVLRSRSESWIQVRDATGATTLQKILLPGESAVVPGTPPLFVVVGNAVATEAVVRGKALDLVAISKDNVARFEVKP